MEQCQCSWATIDRLISYLWLPALCQPPDLNTTCPCWRSPQRHHGSPESLLYFEDRGMNRYLDVEAEFIIIKTWELAYYSIYDLSIELTANPYSLSKRSPMGLTVNKIRQGSSHIASTFTYVYWLLYIFIVTCLIYLITCQDFVGLLKDKGFSLYPMCTHRHTQHTLTHTHTHTHTHAHSHLSFNTPPLK